MMYKIKSTNPAVVGHTTCQQLGSRDRRGGGRGRGRCSGITESSRPAWYNNSVLGQSEILSEILSLTKYITLRSCAPPTCAFTNCHRYRLKMTVVTDRMRRQKYSCSQIFHSADITVLTPVGKHSPFRKTIL